MAAGDQLAYSNPPFPFPSRNAAGRIGRTNIAATLSGGGGPSPRLVPGSPWRFRDQEPAQNARTRRNHREPRSGALIGKGSGLSVVSRARRALHHRIAAILRQRQVHATQTPRLLAP